MATKFREMQTYIKMYKKETGEKFVDMHKVAEFAVRKGWPLPRPKTPIEMLAKEFSEAAREETKVDPVTGNPYRVNHAFKNEKQLTLWVHIDEAPRKIMNKSLIMRREQIVGDALQLTNDAEHWNRVNAQEEPISLPLDFTDDVQWRKNTPKEPKKRPA